MKPPAAEEALALIEELAAPAATAVDIGSPICGICEHELSGEDWKDGHNDDCLVMRARALMKRLEAKKGEHR